MAEVETEVGRKTKQDSPTGIRLGEPLRTELTEMANAEGVGLGALCRDFIEHAVNNKPDRRRRVLLKSVVIVSTQFEAALGAGDLKGTEAEEQADEIQRFFGQLVRVLAVEQEQ